MSATTSIAISELPYEERGMCDDCDQESTHFVSDPGYWHDRELCPTHAAKVVSGEDARWRRQLDYERAVEEARDYATNWESDDDDT